MNPVAQNRWTYRTTALGLTVIVSASGLLAAISGPAGAHATVALDGKNAVAGKRGVITMRIPHGCNGTLATDRVKVKFSKAWRAKPKAVEGWTKKKRKKSNGRILVIWRATAEPLAPMATGEFKVKVRYPKKAGLYATPTIQFCGDVASRWTTPDRGGAEAGHPYPSDYPVPIIKVGSR